LLSDSVPCRQARFHGWLWACIAEVPAYHGGPAPSELPHPMPFTPSLPEAHSHLSRPHPALSNGSESALMPFRLVHRTSHRDKTLRRFQTCANNLDFPSSTNSDIPTDGQPKPNTAPLQAFTISPHRSTGDTLIYELHQSPKRLPILGPTDRRL
jgi:hypothetical protein